MRKTRLIWLVLAISVGCGDANHGGEKHLLGLRFGLGGCGSVAATQGGLARGGTTDLVVTDSQKHLELAVKSESPEVVSPIRSVITLVCTNASKCTETEGTAALTAATEGDARIVLSANDTLVDALQVKVAEAASLTLEDSSRHTAGLTVKVGKTIDLVAKMKSASGLELFAKTPFTWSSEGGALQPTTSTESQVSFLAASAGTTTVTARFGALSASTPVTVEP